MSGAVVKRMRTWAVEEDLTTRAAIELACTSILVRKIAGYVDADGWVEWSRLADDLVAGLPWSSGEKRVARLACSLAGCAPVGVDPAWSLADMLYGLDDYNIAASRAVIYAMTGTLPITAGTAVTGSAA